MRRGAPLTPPQYVNQGAPRREFLVPKPALERHGSAHSYHTTPSVYTPGASEYDGPPRYDERGEPYGGLDERGAGEPYSEDRSLAATLVGGAGGAFLGRKAGAGFLGTVGSAVAGAIAANVAEAGVKKVRRKHRSKKKKDKGSDDGKERKKKKKHRSHKSAGAALAVASTREHRSRSRSRYASDDDDRSDIYVHDRGRDVYKHGYSTGGGERALGGGREAGADGNRVDVFGTAVAQPRRARVCAPLAAHDHRRPQAPAPQRQGPPQEAVELELVVELFVELQLGLQLGLVELGFALGGVWRTWFCTIWSGHLGRACIERIMKVYCRALAPNAPRAPRYVASTFMIL